jgi:hypothetical protein
MAEAEREEKTSEKGIVGMYDGVGFLQLIVMFAFALLLFVGRNGLRDKLGPAINDLLGGGPRPPFHPIPADDSRILTRPREGERGKAAER